MTLPGHGPRTAAALLALVAVLSAGSANGSGAAPGEHWKAYPAPGGAGFDAARLATALSRLDRMNLSSFLVVRGGNVALARGDVERRIDLDGTEAVLLAALVGMRVSDGAFRLEDRLGDLEIRDLDPELTDLQRGATVADLLGRTSCVAHPAAGESVPQKMERGRHLGHAPGAHVWLQPWDLNVLVTLIEREAARGLGEEVAERLARPLGLEDLEGDDVFTKYDLALSIHPALRVRASARDLARLGSLFLRRGAWREERLLPESWIARSTAVRVEQPDGDARGLLFRVHRRGVLGASGAYSLGIEDGQLLAVMPALDLVVVFLAEEERPDAGELEALLADLAGAATRPVSLEADLVPLALLSASAAELRVDPEILRSYEGLYEQECDLSARVRYAERGLEVDLGAGYLPMIPVSQTGFLLESTGERVHFEQDARPPAPRFIHRPFVEREAACFQLLRRYEDAVRLARVNATYYPEEPQVWLQLAEALVLAHRLDEALEAAKTAAALDPGNDRASRLVRQLSEGAPMPIDDHGHRH